MFQVSLERCYAVRAGFCQFYCPLGKIGKAELNKLSVNGCLNHYHLYEQQ